MPTNHSYGMGGSSCCGCMALGMIRPMALSLLSSEFLSVMISRRCHSALYGCLVHNFLPEVSHGSLARVHVLGRHSECRALGALRARGSPRSNSIVCYLDSSLMVQGSRYIAGVTVDTPSGHRARLTVATTLGAEP